MCVELLGGTAELDVAAAADEVPVELSVVAGVAGPYWPLTRTGRNRVAANARENFIIAERGQLLRSQRETGHERLLRVGLTCGCRDDLLSRAKYCKENEHALVEPPGREKGPPKAHSCIPHHESAELPLWRLTSIYPEKFSTPERAFLSGNCPRHIRLYCRNPDFSSPLRGQPYSASSTPHL
jgi:hypothetical protein